MGVRRLEEQQIRQACQNLVGKSNDATAHTGLAASGSRHDAAEQQRASWLSKPLRVLQLYNNYVSGGGGETTMVHHTHDVLEEHGHTVKTVVVDNHQIVGPAAKARAFFSGIYSPSAEHDVTAEIEQFEPDIMHVWNLFPLLSPSVIQAANRLHVPVVMGVQNYQLSCPTASHYSHGELCTRCIGGNEYQCVLHNCKSNAAQSVGYALRSFVANRKGWYRDGVSRFLVVSEKVRSRMIASGYEHEKMSLVPNCVPIRRKEGKRGPGKYAGFVGRVTPEKGIDVLLRAAQISGVPVRVAGDGPAMASLRANAPENVQFIGMLDRTQVSEFYSSARMIVIPSVWDEPFGLVAPEAMSHGLPVIAARSGGLEDIVLPDQTGFLYEPHDAEALANYLCLLWDDEAMCARMGAAARQRVNEQYGSDVYYGRLMEAYSGCLSRVETVG